MGSGKAGVCVITRPQDASLQVGEAGQAGRSLDRGSMEGRPPLLELGSSHTSTGVALESMGPMLTAPHIPESSTIDEGTPRITQLEGP